MAEKLTIHNFGGINDTVIETKPITVFIGPQASGKSVSAKLFYFFRGLGGQLVDAVINHSEIEKFESKVLEHFYQFFPASTWSENFQILYNSSNYEIKVTYAKDDALHIDLGDFFKKALEQHSQSIKDFAFNESLEAYQKELQLAIDSLRNEISLTLGFNSKANQFFIPAGRAMFSYLRNSDIEKLLDPSLKSFGFLMDNGRVILENIGFFDNKIAKQLDADYEEIHRDIALILQAKPIRFEQQDYLQSEDRKIPFSSASSGQQEAWPLLLLLARLISFGFALERSLYIEEPEAHLFPKAQQVMVEFLAQTYNKHHINDNNAPFMSQIITTHSPYVLTAFNNLIQAGIAHRKAADNHELKQKLEKIIPENKAIYPEEIIAYSFQNGQATPIMDAESQLITADYIDQVSEDIAEDFDKLLWLE